jgi:hypothetical protein
LSLTSRGRGAARRVLATRNATLDTALASLSPAERDSLVTITEKMLGAITRERLSDREQGRIPPGGSMCRLCDIGACGRNRDTLILSGSADRIIPRREQLKVICTNARGRWIIKGFGL